MSLKLQKFLSRSCFKHLLRTKRQIWPSHNTAHNFKTNSRTQTDIYPQRLVGPTRSDFTPIFGEASIVDRPWRGWCMTSRDKLSWLFLFLKSQNTLLIKINLFSIWYTTWKLLCEEVWEMHTPSPDRAALCWPSSAPASRPVCKPLNTRAETEPTALRQETASAPNDARLKTGTPETAVSPHCSVWKRHNLSLHRTGECVLLWLRSWQWFY